MVVSGLLAAEADPAREAFGRVGLGAEKILEDGDWVAILLRR
jgi:ribosomal protein L11 methylase PrmA